jgi:hypothetical protein
LLKFRVSISDASIWRGNEPLIYNTDWHCAGRKINDLNHCRPARSECARTDKPSGIFQSPHRTAGVASRWRRQSVLEPLLANNFFAAYRASKMEEFAACSNPVDLGKSDSVQQHSALGNPWPSATLRGSERSNCVQSRLLLLSKKQSSAPSAFSCPVAPGLSGI